jgi:hypothetical protein
MMLRTFVLVAAALFLTAALIGVVLDPGTWPTVLTAGLLAGGIAFERVRYGAVQRAPDGPDWRETSERFIDDVSGKPVSVWFDAKTGERRYVAMEQPDAE